MSLRIRRRHLPPFCYAERDLQAVHGVIVHYVSAVNVDPGRRFSPDAVVALLTDLNRPAAARSRYVFEPAHRLHGSYHYLIGRRGGVYELVPLPRVAWHAGVSRLGGRSGCNDFCVGVSLIATAESGFTAAQYGSLCRLIAWLRGRYPIAGDAIRGHEDVAEPAGRKADPGPLFDWQRLREVMT